MKHTIRFGLIAFSVSCGAPVQPTTIRVETSAPVVQLPAQEWAGVRFVTSNVGQNAVYLARCGDGVMAAVDRWEGASWVQYSGDGCLHVNIMAPLALPAGERREDLRAIGERGVYRLRLGITAERSQPLTWNVISNVFEIR